MNPVLSALMGLARFTPEAVPDALDYAIVESPAEIRFVKLGTDGLEPWREFPRGVAFSMLAELRWERRQAGTWHLVYLHDQGRVLAGATHQEKLQRVEGLPERIFLRGERQSDGRYVEGRIPAPLAYPPGVTGTRPMLGMRHYLLDGSPLARLAPPGGDGE